jgi:hypothetical protein
MRARAVIDPLSIQYLFKQCHHPLLLTYIFRTITTMFVVMFPFKKASHSLNRSISQSVHLQGNILKVEIIIFYNNNGSLFLFTFNSSTSPASHDLLEDPKSDPGLLLLRGGDSNQLDCTISSCKPINQSLIHTHNPQSSQGVIIIRK